MNGFNDNDLIVFTDGACKNIGLVDHKYTHTFGAWAYVIVEDGKVIQANYQAYSDTTNNRMEMAALLEAFKYIDTVRKYNQKVRVYTDSAYVCNAYQQYWYKNWQRNGWQTAKGEPVKNRDLWEALIPYFENNLYEVYKVKGHDGNQYNEMCDKYASDAAQNLKNKWREQDGLQDYVRSNPSRVRTLCSFSEARNTGSLNG